MLAAALALMLQQAAVPSAPEDEITVIGRRMRAMRFVVNPDRRHGGYRCLVRRSSGDPALDTAICDVGLRCVRDATAASQVQGCVRTALDALPGLYASERQQVRVDPAAK